MFKLIKTSIILLLLINIFAIGVLGARSAETTIIDKAECLKFECKAGDTSPQAKICCGNYSLNDMVGVATKIADIILSIVGSLSLLAFVAGGLMLMLSGGNAEWVTRGKQTLIGAVIGLIIVFTSYMIIQLVFDSLGIKGAETGLWSKITSKGTWFK